MQNKVNFHECRQEFEMKIHPSKFAFATLMMDLDLKKKYDNKIVSHELIFCYEEQETIFYFYRITTKKVLMSKGRELVFASAFSPMGDGKYMEVCKSYDDPSYPLNDNFERLDFKKSGTIFEEVNNKGIKTYKAIVYQFFNPKTNVKLKLCKSFLVNFWKNYFMNVFKEVEEYLEQNSGDSLWSNFLANYEQL